MGCHRSQRSSGICESVFFVFVLLYFSEDSSRAEPLEKRRERKLRDSSSLPLPFLPRMKVCGQSELSFPENFLAPLYITSPDV